MAFKEIICPNCLKTVPVDSEQSSGFCIYCGETLSADQSIEENDLQLDDSQVNWDELFEEEKYSTIIQKAAQYSQAGQANFETNIYYLLARIKNYYDDYHHEAIKETTGKSLVMKMLTSFVKASSTDTSYHKEFLNNVKKSSEELFEILLAEKENHAEIVELAAKRSVYTLVYFDLESYTNTEAISYEALEKNAITFFALLSNDELVCIFNLYKPYSRKRLFGKDVFKAIKAEKNKRNL